MGYIYGVLPPLPPLRPFPGVQPVKPHITLVKLKKPAKVEIRYRSFAASLSGVSLLPSESRPRYVALLVEPRGEFSALRTMLEAALGDLVEEKHGEFKPHLSVYAVRIKRPVEEDLAPAVEEAKRYVGFAFEVRAIHLLDTSGGLYTPLYTVNLYG